MKLKVTPMLKKSIVPGLGLLAAAALGALLTSALVSVAFEPAPAPANALAAADRVLAPSGSKIAPKMRIDTIKPATRSKLRRA
jgi:hypothetical protein